MNGVKITGIGRYLPEKVLTNNDVAAILQKNCQTFLRRGVELTPEEIAQHQTDDVWIKDRTGIETRRMTPPDEATSDLAVKAAEQALRHAGLKKDAVDLMILGTVSNDYLFSPPTVAEIQRRVGLPRGIEAFDTTAACSSFLAALSDVYAKMRAGLRRHALVIGADVMTRTVDWNNRNVSVILGDGAGAFVLEAVDSAQDQFISPPYVSIDGTKAELIMARLGGSKNPLTPEMMVDPKFVLHREDKICMNGRRVFKEMVSFLPDLVIETVAKANLKIEQIDFFAFHQANLRILEAVEQALRESGLRHDSIIYNNIQWYGNTTSASIPLILYDAWEEGVLRAGMTVMLVGFGGGFTWGTAIFKWPELPEMF